MAMDLLKKLRVAAEKPLWLINAPVDCRALFDGFEIQDKLKGKKAVPQLLFFAYDSSDFAKYLPLLADHIGHDTLFWICYPKKSGSIQSDLVQMKPWDIVFSSGYRGQTSASINDDWTGLRVTNAPRTKPSDCDIPMEERKVEGVDFVKRTVQLPPDAQAAVNRYKGLSAVFDAMSFTNKKEAVMAILDAKKEETRVRRIQKLIAELQQKIPVTKSK